MASIDKIMEAPIIATEADTDPAAPASGEGAGEEAGERSWAEAKAEKRATMKTTVMALNVLTGAIVNR